MKSAVGRRVCRFLLAAAASFLCACSPGLNWREVHVGELTAMLPCKPDSATRQIALDKKSYEMNVTGCEVAGDLFVISLLQAEDHAQAPLAMAHLRAASLAAVKARNVHPMPDSGDAQSSFDVQVAGLRPDGTPVQVRFKWLMLGTEIYQLGVYAATLSEEQTGPLMHESRLK